MTNQILRSTAKYASAAFVLAGLLGAVTLVKAAADQPKKAAAPAKPAAKAAPAKPAATGGAKPATATHTMTTTHTTTTTGGVHPTTTTTTTRTTTNTGGHVGNAPGPRNASFGGHAAPVGAHDRSLAGGSAIRTRSNGRVSDVHDARRGMDVHHGLDGSRRVSVMRSDHSRLVAERGRRGYVERGYSYHGHDYARRSYYWHGRAYDRYYRGYGYHGMMLNVYAPGYYYAPGFYGWAYNPWARPIAFGWGWGGNPWYGYYGYYFQPYPTYASAAFWLTDYIISQDLQAAYAARQAATAEAAGAPPDAAAGGQPVLTPEVKQMIADEVKAQLALENQEATQTAQGQDVDPGSSGIARLLSDGRPHVFVAGGNLDVTDASGQECAVSDGDALELRQPPPNDAQSANLVVLSSKGKPECQISLTVQVQLTDLQEMQNHMRETIDQGLQDLQAKQGTGGLPPAPPSAKAPPTQSQYAAVAPPPEPDLGNQIQQQDQAGDQAEKDVNAEAAGGTAAPGGSASAVPDSGGGPGAVGSAAPATQASVELGQTPDQVQATLGAPTRIASLGPKQIYYYNGMKVTFQDGKVSDVQ